MTLMDLSRELVRRKVIKPLNFRSFLGDSLFSYKIQENDTIYSVRY